MPWRIGAYRALVAALALAAGSAYGEDLPLHPHPGYYTPRSVYGYRPYRPLVGPIRARYELDDYVDNPRQAGVDYSWGIGYFFGFGPGDRAFQAARPR